jgi:hypothetical protein
MGHQLLDWGKFGSSSMDSLLLSYACIHLTFRFSSSDLFWNSLCSSYQVLSPANSSLLIASKLYSVYHYCKGGETKNFITKAGGWVAKQEAVLTRWTLTLPSIYLRIRGRGPRERSSYV